MSNKIINRKQLAEMLGVSYWTLCKWLASDHPRIPQPDVDSRYWSRELAKKIVGQMTARGVGNPDVEWLSGDELCLLLGISPSTLSNRVRKGIYPPKGRNGLWCRGDFERRGIPIPKKPRPVGRFMNAAEVAHELGVSIAYVMRLAVHDGSFPKRAAPGLWKTSEIRKYAERFRKRPNRRKRLRSNALTA